MRSERNVKNYNFLVLPGFLGFPIFVSLTEYARLIFPVCLVKRAIFLVPCEVHYYLVPFEMLFSLIPGEMQFFVYPMEWNVFSALSMKWIS